VATVSVTVTNVADAPVANPDSATVNEDSGATFIDVLGNDTDADNLSPTPSNTGLTVSGVGGPATGRRPSRRIGVTYTPASDYYGPDSFTYTIVDAQGNTATATVRVTVTMLPTRPWPTPIPSR
jgi:hypothetical protein